MQSLHFFNAYAIRDASQNTWDDLRGSPTTPSILEYLVSRDTICLLKPSLLALRWCWASLSPTVWWQCWESCESSLSWCGRAFHVCWKRKITTMHFWAICPKQAGTNGYTPSMGPWRGQFWKNVGIDGRQQWQTAGYLRTMKCWPSLLKYTSTGAKESTTLMISLRFSHCTMANLGLVQLVSYTAVFVLQVKW